MGKLIFSFVLLLLTVPGFSQKTKILNGDLSFLKEASSVHLSFTYDDLMVGKMKEKDYISKRKSEAEKKEAGSGEKWEESWKNDRTRTFEPFFEKRINEEVENISFSSNNPAEITLNVATTFIEPGFNVGVASKNAYINLTYTFSDKNGKNLATIEMLKIPGRDAMGVDFDTSWRISEAYNKAAKELGKMIKKTIK